MRGIGKNMKKRPFPDEEADEREAAVEDEPVEDEAVEDEAPPAEEDPDEESAPAEGETTDTLAADAPTEGGGDGQAVYEKFVKNGLRLIYGKDMRETILKALEGNGNPPAGLANTALMIGQRLESSAAKAGAPVPPDVVEQGTLELMVDMAKFSAASGGHKYTPEELSNAKRYVGIMRKKMAGGAGPEQPGAAPAPAAGPQPRGLGPAMAA